MNIEHDESGLTYTAPLTPEALSIIRAMFGPRAYEEQIAEQMAALAEFARENRERAASANWD